ncbi:MAG: fibro-slime domain-containing protein [Proteobacteria bacterium]|nr:fibro-slime domain-containing protein [Pseudomonadota bacterium]
MRRAVIVGVLVLGACGSRLATQVDGGGDDAGTDAPLADSPASIVDGQACGALTVVLRDFQASHPDFEHALGDDRGLVQPVLGTDNKPVYAPAGATTTVSGATSFDQWYRDVPGVNMTFTQPLPLTESPPGTFTFDDQTFFPLDGLGFGNEGNADNFHFTSEIHGTFTYRGGEVFQFVGDDDVFVFVNKRLALDLGGIHGAESQTVDFDASAGQLGITPGMTYQLDVFHAERHTTQSTFRMVTTIDCFIIQ